VGQFSIGPSLSLVRCAAVPPGAAPNYIVPTQCRVCVCIQPVICRVCRFLPQAQRWDRERSARSNHRGKGVQPQMTVNLEYGFRSMAADAVISLLIMDAMIWERRPCDRHRPRALAGVARGFLSGSTSRKESQAEGQ
jgi:hypothetical protein